MSLTVPTRNPETQQVHLYQLFLSKAFMNIMMFTPEKLIQRCWEIVAEIKEVLLNQASIAQDETLCKATFVCHCVACQNPSNKYQYVEDIVRYYTITFKVISRRFPMFNNYQDKIFMVVNFNKLACSIPSKKTITKRKNPSYYLKMFGKILGFLGTSYTGLK